METLVTINLAQIPTSSLSLWILYRVHVRVNPTKLKMQNYFIGETGHFKDAWTEQMMLLNKKLKNLFFDNL